MEDSTSDTCPHCQARVQPADRYCSTCGALRPGAVVLELDEAPAAEGRPLRRAAPWTAVLLVLLHVGLAVGAAAGVYAWLGQRAASRTPRVAPGEPRLLPAPPLTALPAADAALSATRDDLRSPSPSVAPDARVAAPAKPSKSGKSGKNGKQTKPPRPATAAKPPRPAARPPAAGPGTRPQPEHPTSSADAADDLTDLLRGQLDGESVRMVVHHHLPQIQSCYERALKSGADVGGVVEIRIVIAGDGQVRQATVERNSTGHEGLGKCIAYTMSRWRFPRPVGGVEIEVIYPFSFAADGR